MGVKLLLMMEKKRSFFFVQITTPHKLVLTQFRPFQCFLHELNSYNSSRQRKVKLVTPTALGERDIERNNGYTSAATSRTAAAAAAAAGGGGGGGSGKTTTSVTIILHTPCSFPPDDKEEKIPFLSDQEETRPQIFVLFFCVGLAVVLFLIFITAPATTTPSRNLSVLLTSHSPLHLPPLFCWSLVNQLYKEKRRRSQNFDGSRRGSYRCDPWTISISCC